jgi:prephenate dehydratase
MRVAFLGPSPTFAERAARVLAAGATLEPRGDIGALFGALAAGEVDAIVTPFENSAAGRVEETLNAMLILHRPLAVLGERVDPVRLSLYRRAEDAAPLGRVLGHPAALAQCRRWIARHHAAPVAAGSNGAAFASVAASDRPGAGALAPLGCATGDMVEAAHDCQGGAANHTRFLMLGAAAPAAAMRALVFAHGSGAVEVTFPRPVAQADLPGRPLLLWAGDAPTGSRVGWPSATAHVWRMT